MKQNELGSSARESESLVGVSECMEQDPEYHGTRETLWEAGGVAQLGEHLPCKQGVRSSILLISTKLFYLRTLTTA